MGADNPLFYRRDTTSTPHSPFPTQPPPNPYPATSGRGLLPPATIMTTEIRDFASLLKATAEEPQPQRLLFVFLQPVLPEGHTPEEARRFAAGQGGALDPVVCVDKAPDELTTFADLVAESEQMGADWKIVLIAALAGKDGVAPTSDEAETALNVMLNTVKDGRPLGRFVALTRAGERVNFG